MNLADSSTRAPHPARIVPLIAFFAIAFLFTWSMLPWARTSVPIGLVALFGPAVAAVIVSTWAGRPDREALRARVTDWRIPARWYFVALALPLPITVLRSGLEYAMGARGAIQFQPIHPLSVIVFFLVIGEEVGWRGFALPRLLERFGPWSASAVLGAAWALWHLPLFSMPAMPQFGAPFAPFVAYTIALSVLLTFLGRNTRGSVVIATLFHAAVNTFGIVNTAATPALRGWTNALSYGAAAAVIGAVAWRRARGR
jgi:membrane protease YdiL (CAAX protease family)